MEFSLRHHRTNRENFEVSAALVESKCFTYYYNHYSLQRHWWVGNIKCMWPVKKRVDECWYYGVNDPTEALHVFQFWLASLPPHHLLLHYNPEWFVILTELPRLSCILSIKWGYNVYIGKLQLMLPYAVTYTLLASHNHPCCVLKWIS